MPETAEQAARALDLGTLPSRTRSAVLVRAVSGTSTAVLHGWAAGPVPFVQPTNETTRARGTMPTTDTAARKTLVATTQARVLYENSAGMRRSHKILKPVVEAGSTLAVELHLEVPATQGLQPCGLVAVHVADTTTSSGHLSDALRPDSAAGETWWETVTTTLPADLTMSGNVRALHYEDLTGTSEDPTAWRTSAYGRITGADELGSRDAATRAQRHLLTIERPDWSALIMRDGAAFISHQRSTEPFAPTLRTLVHSVYLDALLLAWLQRQLLNRSATAATSARLDHSRDLVELERKHFEFKRTFWRTSLTDKRTSPVDEALRAFQEELLTPRDVQDVEETVREGARLARTLQAEEAEAAQNRLTKLVRNATIIVGSFTLCFTAATVLTDPSVGAFIWAALLSVAGCLAAFGVLWISGRADRSESGKQGNESSS